MEIGGFERTAAIGHFNSQINYKVDFLQLTSLNLVSFTSVHRRYNSQNSDIFHYKSSIKVVHKPCFVKNVMISNLSTTSKPAQTSQSFSFSLYHSFRTKNHILSTFSHVPRSFQHEVSAYSAA